MPVGSDGDFNGDGFYDRVISDRGYRGKTLTLFGKADGFAKETRVFEEQPLAFGEGVELVGQPLTGWSGCNVIGYTVSALGV